MRAGTVTLGWVSDPSERSMAGIGGAAYTCEVADNDELGTAKTKADQLTTRILELRDAYYERDELLVSDAEYDTMMRRLEELERMFPELQGQDSPT